MWNLFVDCIKERVRGCDFFVVTSLLEQMHWLLVTRDGHLLLGKVEMLHQVRTVFVLFLEFSQLSTGRSGIQMFEWFTQGNII